jgi:hypothetical protein
MLTQRLELIREELFNRFVLNNVESPTDWKRVDPFSEMLELYPELGRLACRRFRGQRTEIDPVAKQTAREIAEILIVAQGEARDPIKHGGYWAAYPLPENFGPSFFRGEVRIPTAVILGFLNLLRWAFNIADPRLVRAINRAALFSSVLFYPNPRAAMEGWDSRSADARYIAEVLYDGGIFHYAAARCRRCEELQFVVEVGRKFYPLKISEAFNSLSEPWENRFGYPFRRTIECKLSLPPHRWMGVFDAVLGREGIYCVKLGDLNL